MSKIEKILWPTDLSHSCGVVLPVLCELAKKHGAEIEVLYVGVALGDIEPMYGGPTEEHIRRYNEWEIERSKERMDKFCKQPLEDCPLVTKKVVLGEPFQEIMKAIKEDKIDMVVLATRGQTSDTSGSMTLGGVVDKVIRNSPVPVVTVNP